MTRTIRDARQGDLFAQPAPPPNEGELRLDRFVCVDCGARFTARDQGHKWNWNDERKAHVCRACDGTASPLDAMPERRPFLCGCGATFTEKEAAALAEDDEGHLICRSCERAQEEAIAEAEAQAELEHPAATDEDENERGELTDDWYAEHQRTSALARDGRAISRLEWRESSKRTSMSAGGGGYLLEWFEDAGRFYYRTEKSIHNSGSTGPFREDREARDVPSFLLARMRGIIAGAARAFAQRGHSDGETRWQQMQKMATWAIEQCPPLLYGADLAEELEALKLEEEERERQRCAALRAQHELEEAMYAAKDALLGVELEHTPNAWHRKMYGDPAASYTRADVCVQGEWPDRMRVMIYSARPHYQGEIKDEATPAELEALREGLAARLAVPVLIAPRELQLAHYYPVVRRALTYPMDRYRSYHLRQLGMTED